ncbi:OsmC family protein [Flavobacterium weaverense]|uniref:Putative redox protein n=1 Tax=Flavobacterium weaverense TaxID=271156 RepID=A0A3L9ZT45_9FLAO|nr:OsmC family protein [Flavobacterium weaverense]RMA76111.1 putative redox protein [Flavobacterium weaverense]
MDKITAHIGSAFYKTEIKSATNTIISDEPKSDGGMDLGFSPYELLASSLAACTCITLRMYANRKGWELQDIKVEVNIVEEAEEKKTTIIRSIELFGSLDTEQKKRLLNIANKCPVHNILTNTIEVKTDIIQ